MSLNNDTLRELIGQMDTDAASRYVLKALSDPATAQSAVRLLLEALAREPIDVPYVVLDGGTAPKRMTDGAVGFDLCVRAIVSAHEMDPEEPRLRKTIFDFRTKPDDPRYRGYVQFEHYERGRQLMWSIPPGESVLVGVGVAFALPYELFQWTAPRSGLASKLHITLGNAPGTIDSDYRGEAGLIVVNNGKTPFLLSQGDRIGQMLFQPVLIPRLVKVDSLDELGVTTRGSGGFGSTGYDGQAP